MPEFSYAPDPAPRDAFVAAAEGTLSEVKQAFTLFDTETAADAGRNALRALHVAGDLTRCAAGVRTTASLEGAVHRGQARLEAPEHEAKPRPSPWRGSSGR